MSPFTPAKIVIDTDIGTDVDDALALGLALRSPELELIAVTTVYGDVDLRTRMARKLLGLAGRSAVPVGKGIREPLLRSRPVYWAGHEGEGLLGPADASLSDGAPHADDLLIETILAHPGEITLVPIGPLTNVAVALTREPAIATKLQGIVMMGGVVRAANSIALGLPWVEHNIRCDPEAAHVVLKCGAPITMVPLDVTLQVTIDRAGLERIRAAGSPLALAVGDQLARYPRFAGMGATFTHDQLAVAMAIDRSFCRTAALRVEVETRGDLTAGATVALPPTADRPANVDVCVEVDAARFQEFLVSRLAQ